MDVSRLTEKLLADTIDYAYLKPNGTRKDIEEHCLEAVQYKFAMVAINPSEIGACVKLLKGSQVRVGAAIGFHWARLHWRSNCTKSRMRSSAAHVKWTWSSTSVRLSPGIWTCCKMKLPAQ
jgi:deoxyribose-phosphate aldolase